MEENQVETLAALMKHETRLFEDVLAEESIMTASIRDREWPKLEDAIRRVDAIETQISEIELKRSQVYAELCRKADLPAEASFYQWAVLLPQDVRASITEQYRQLKFRALEARASGSAISNHLAESKALLNGILEELFPQRRGNIYNKSGHSRKSELASIIVNHRF
jgi:hypothetical protein